VLVGSNIVHIEGTDGTFLQANLDSLDKRVDSFLNRITSGKMGTDDVGAFFLMMEKDQDGIYHARRDCWLQIGGYNDLYDKVFDLGTSMAKEKFTFKSGGREYIFWAWKGDYVNLGAGAELGIYKRLVVNGVSMDHWLVDSTNLTFPMSLNLSYNGEEIIDYNPIDRQWWITGFNPEYKDVAAGELTATFTVDFAGRESMYHDFIKSDDYLDNIAKWSISGEYKLTLTF
jgi:hypothetical protein